MAGLQPDKLKADHTADKEVDLETKEGLMAQISKMMVGEMFSAKVMRPKEKEG